MSKYLMILFLSLFEGCTSIKNDSPGKEIGNRNSSAISNRVEITNESASVSPTPSGSSYDSINTAETSRNTRCEDYRLETARHDDSNFINLFQGGATPKIIKLPTGLSVNGFALNYVKKTGNGFLFSIEYGSRFYYGKEFHFVCKGGEFYLTKVFVRTHDQADPENSTKESTMRITPPVSLDRFSIANYMKE